MTIETANKPRYRYLYDINSATLHDIKGTKNARNIGCRLSDVTDWISFDLRSSPEKGITIRKLTATREVMDIDVKTLCSHCIESEEESREIVHLLRDYMLKK